MFGLWVSHQDWEKILRGVPEEHCSKVRSYLASNHYRIIGMLHVVKRYRIGRPEGLPLTLSESLSCSIGRRYVAIARARKKTRKIFAILAGAGLSVSALILCCMWLLEQE